MEVNDLYIYDETSPTCLRWSVDIYSGRNANQKNVSVGDVAGGMGNSGYYQVRKQGKLQLVHRVIWEMYYGSIPENLFLDHKDGNRTNNKLSNLRLVQRSLNARNCQQREDNTSGVTGVTLLKNTLRSGNIAYLWRAFWCELSGEKKSKSFNIGKYGDEVAFQMACDYRKEQIERLNKEGAGYTERHLTTT